MLSLYLREMGMDDLLTTALVKSLRPNSLKESLINTWVSVIASVARQSFTVFSTANRLSRRYRSSQ
jgi:hypothetical protein